MFAEAPIHGADAPGFEEVESVFRQNLRERDELGAACAIYHKGKMVVDLWGGYRDLERRQPWEEDTLVLVYSTTKGLAGMTIALAHSRGMIDYDEKGWASTCGMILARRRCEMPSIGASEHNKNLLVDDASKKSVHWAN